MNDILKIVDLIEIHKKVTKLQADYPNDQEFGKVVRPLFKRKPKNGYL
tara:strand:+ start:2784 stop:2927 length:144 start_codon:yes stop_codon:yes gene_type:complete